MITIKRHKKLYEGQEAAPALAAQQAAPAAPAQQAQLSAANNQQLTAPALAAQNQQQLQGDQAQQAPQINPVEASQAVNNFLAGIANNIKQACTVDAISKAVPQIKLAKDSKAVDVAKLEESVANIAKVEVKPEDVATVLSVMQAFGAMIQELANFTKTLAEKAPKTEGQPQQAAPALAAQQAAPAQPAA